MTGKTICTAETIEELETLINEYFYSTSYKVDGYFYSTSYKVDGDRVRSEKTGKTLDDYFVYHDVSGRFRFCRKEV